MCGGLKIARSEVDLEVTIVAGQTDHVFKVAVHIVSTVNYQFFDAFRLHVLHLRFGQAKAFMCLKDQVRKTLSIRTELIRVFEVLAHRAPEW